MKRFARVRVSLAIVSALSTLTLSGCGDSNAIDVDALSSYPYPDGGAVDTPYLPTFDAVAFDHRDTSLWDSQWPDLPLTLDVNSDAEHGVDSPIPDAPNGIDGVACPTSCDDNNPCTVDSCDLPTGNCVNTSAAEGSACMNACVSGGQGQCTLGICKGTPASDGTPCDDNDPCTLGDACQNGLCFSGAAMPCPAIDSCHESGHCERKTGACTTPQSSEGKACDDGLACTTGDQCISGKCGGTTLACSASASCGATTGICAAGVTAAFPSATLEVSLPGVRLSAPGALAQDAAGDVFLVGVLTSATDLGSGPIAPAGAKPDASAALAGDILVAKIDPSSARATWSKPFGDEQDQQGNRIAVNRQGQAIISGLFKGSLVFGSKTITNPTADFAEAFVAAVDVSTGAGLWAVRPQISGSDLVLAADPLTSDFVVCGSASNRPALGLAASASGGDDGDIVVARLDAATGSPVWGRQIVVPGLQTCDSVAVDGTGHVFLTGTMASAWSGSDDGGAQSLLDFGSGVQLQLPIQHGSTSVIWIAKLDVTTGNAITATSFGAPQGGSQSAQMIACDTAGNVLLVGGIKQAAQVGSTTISGTAIQSGLVVKLDSQLKPLWFHGWAGEGATLPTLIAEEPAGTLMVAGTYSHLLVLDGISLAIGKKGTTSSFVARLDSASGSVLSARGHGGPGAAQYDYGLAVTQSGSDTGAIWLAGVFTGTLQLGPPAVAIAASVGQTGFLGKIAP
jgi:hypothetical protein